MTTWQDDQPMSRRALRESERAHAQATMSDTGEVEPQKTDFDQQIWSQGSISEPVDYSAQVRVGDRQADDALLRPRQSGTSRTSSESSGYRLRDFSPDSRGASFSSTPSAPWTPPSAGSEDLSYHTSVGADRPVTAAYSAPTSTPPIVVTPEELRAHDLESSPDTDDRQIEQTLTRRQLREMREAAESRMVEVSPIVEPGSLFTPFVKATRESTVESTVDRTVDRTVDSTRESVRESAQSAEIAAAMAEFDNLYAEPHEIPALIEPPRESLRFEEPRRFEPVAAPLAEPELTAVVPKPIVKDQPGAAVELTPVFEPMVEDDPELAFEPMEEVEPEFAFHADVQHESDYEFEPRDEDEPKFEFEPLDEHEQVDQHDPRFEFEPQLDGGAARASGEPWVGNGPIMVSPRAR